MKKISGVKAAVAMLLLAGMIAVIAGCGGGLALVGRWELEHGQPTRGNIEAMELLKDGTGIVDEVGVSWKVDNGRFYITASLGASAYDYKVSGETLTLTDKNNTSLTYRKIGKKDTSSRQKNHARNSFICTWTGNFGGNEGTFVIDRSTWALLDGDDAAHSGPYTINGKTATFKYYNGNIVGTATVSRNRLVFTSGRGNESFTLTKKRARSARRDAKAKNDAMGESDNKTGLVVWSSTDELAEMILGSYSYSVSNDTSIADVKGMSIADIIIDGIESSVSLYYSKAFPDIKIQLSRIIERTAEQFPSMLDSVLASGDGAPDVFALDSSFVRKYVESGLLLDITDIYEKNRSKILAYPVEVGSHNGKVYAMSWQAAPGAFFYRRSIAKKYLGTDDPKAVQTYFTDFNKFLETARLLKQRSNGSCVVVSSLGDLQFPFYSTRKDPWVVNGRLVIDPVMDQYFDISKTLYDNRLEGRVGWWSVDWVDGMRGALRGVEVFGYFLTTWGLRFMLENGATNTAGDWAMVPGPVPYSWGGTWIGVYKGTNNKEIAKELVRYLITDDAYLEKHAKASGDLVSNTVVVNKIKNSYKEPFLGRQNHYAEFADMAQNVNGKLIQGTDQAIQDIFDKEVLPYTWGEKSKEQALADFRTQVKAKLGF